MIIPKFKVGNTIRFFTPSGDGGETRIERVKRIVIVGEKVYYFTEENHCIFEEEVLAGY